MTTSIFGFKQPTSHAPKIHVSHTQLSTTYLDPTQLPTHRPPWRQLRTTPFIHSLHLAMPKRCWTRLYHLSDPTELAANLPTNAYAKVILKLSDILADDDLRRSECLMLSSASACTSTSADTAITLDRGTLSIEMPRSVYERAGLAFPAPPRGNRVRSGARKHDPRSERRRIELNLREPGMVKGRKGFDRLVWAARNVEGLMEPRVWLHTQIETGEKGERGVKRKRDDREGGNPGTSDFHKGDGMSELDTEHGARIGDDKHRVTSGTTADTPTSAPVTDTAQQQQQQQKQTHPLARHHPTLLPNQSASLTVQPHVLVPRTISHPHFFASLSSSSSHTQNHQHHQQQHQQHLEISPQQRQPTTPVLDEDDIHDLAEYLSLLLLQSPLIAPTNTNTTTRRQGQQHHDHADADADAEKAEEITTAAWSGLLSRDFALAVLADLIRRSRSHQLSEPDPDGHDATRRDAGPLWAVLQVTAHGVEADSRDGCVVLLHGREEGVEGEGEDVVESARSGTNQSLSQPQTQSQSQSRTKRERNTEKMEREARRGFMNSVVFEYVDCRS